jgi:hypothetical protein
MSHPSALTKLLLQESDVFVFALILFEIMSGARIFDPPAVMSDRFHRRGNARGGEDSRVNASRRASAGPTLLGNRRSPSTNVPSNRGSAVTGGYINVSGNLNVSVQNIEKAGAKRKISILLEILNFSHCFEITAK